MTGWDAVYGYLLTYLPTVVGTVYDGTPITKTPGQQFAIVGENGDGDAGFYTYEPQDMDALLREAGSVNVRFVAQSGDVDLPSLRLIISGWSTTLRTHLSGNQTLSGVLKQGSVVKLDRVDIGQPQTTKGAVVDAIATVSYVTRL